MAYAQWVSYTINSRNFDATLEDARLDWGKFYQWDNKDDELKPSAIDGIKIDSGGTAYNVVSACGRENATSGTEGSFKIYHGTKHVATLIWDCPWGSKRNSWNTSYVDDDYMVSSSGGSQDSGAIGTLTYQLAYFPPA